MTLLDRTISGKIQAPISVLLYGKEGVGKSTWASEAPSPYFIDVENGTKRLNVNRFVPKNFSEIIGIIREIRDEKHDFKTLVVDTVDATERLIWEEVCRANNWKNIEEPGYGKGYAVALKEWVNLKDLILETAHVKNMNLIILAHYEVKTFQDPYLNQGWDKYQIKLNQKAAALWRENVESVMFAATEVFTKKDGQKTRAYGDGARVCFTLGRPSFDAKNRYGLPFQLPLSWESFIDAVQSGDGDSVAAIKDRIGSLISQVRDESVKKKAEESTKTEDITMLKKIENRLLVLTQQC